MFLTELLFDDDDGEEEEGEEEREEERFSLTWKGEFISFSEHVCAR